MPHDEKAISYPNPPKATIDFETRSACELRYCGSWRYSLDATTEVLCLAFRLPAWVPGRVEVWHPSFPGLGAPEEGRAELDELLAWVESGGLVEAHNAWFERGIWENICVSRHAWPEVRPEQWRCSAAKAAAYSLPRSLAGCSAALRLSELKDLEGAKTMMKMAKPRKPLKADIFALVDADGRLSGPAKKSDAVLIETASGAYAVQVTEAGATYSIEMPVLWHESLELLKQLCEYCKQDVRAEEAVSSRLRDLSASETEVYLMDQAINARGFQLDGEGVEAALGLVQDTFIELNAELVALTNGEVEKATQRARMVKWFNANGLPIENTQGSTLAACLRRGDLKPKLRRGVELVLALGKSSTAKFIAAKNWANSDSWRVHGSLLYHGAGTGRWSGSGVQPHNFPRGTIKDMNLAWEVIKTRDAALAGMLYGDAMTLLSHSLRGMITATPGRRLMVADYAAIEARVILWLAEDAEALEVFRRGECIYMAMATSVYGYPVTDKVKQAAERQMGKQAVLGLGYQMGARKFQGTLAEKWGIFIEPEFAEKIVFTYREKFWRVKKLWNDQERTAIAAVKNPGRVIPCAKVAWQYVDGFLHCKLPSGRLLGYSSPQVLKRLTPWGAERDVLTYMGTDPYTRKWVRQDTYGGMLVENITQAVARDLMASAMLKCEREGVYDVVLSVHDELVAEADKDKGSVEDFENVLASTPPWAEGCPVSAEGWTGYRYRK